MNFLKRNFSFFIIAISFFLNRTFALNSSTVIIKPFKYHVPIIPIVTNISNGPKMFERIIVPIDSTPPLKHRTYEKKKSIVSENREKEPPEEKKVKSSTMKPNSNSNSRDYDDGKGNFQKSFSYVSRKDEHGKIPTNTKPNEIQPLHISTRDFKASTPERMSTETAHEKTKKIKEQRKRLKVEHLPEDPNRIPETSWWDNIKQYNYGIIHDDIKNLENIPTLGEIEQDSIEDVSEVESKEMEIPATVVIKPVEHSVVHHVQPSLINIHNPSAPSPSIKFKSSFKSPNQQTEVHHRSDNPGRFLYKTQVYYPNYRDHLYLPITTYYGHHQGLAKVHPIFTSHHTVHHNELPHPTASPITPKKINSVSQPPPLLPSHKRDPPPKKSPSPTPPKEENKEVERGEEDDDEEDNSDDYEDYDENDKDKYQGESQEAENGSEEVEESDEEEEEEEKPSHRYNSFRNKDDSSESAEREDQFDLAWKKYGYGKKTAGSDEEDDSYESSESRIVPERKKIVHMKMEYYSTPRKDTEDLIEASSSDDPKKYTETVNVDKKIERKRRRKSKDSGKGQKQHPNAGPDDLKFFQYLSYLGDGEHRAGVRSGNDKHYIEQHERGNHKTGQFQKKIVWADKHGGYGQHFYDLNHN